MKKDSEWQIARERGRNTTERSTKRERQRKRERKV